jgi:hypothetical protein
MQFDCFESEDNSTPEPCIVPRDLLESLLDNTIELMGERIWWKYETRSNYQRDYERYQEDVKQVKEILNQKS